ncbi:helix-turn-helix transcriptional regulator [Streptococcus sp. 27098_8_66]|uniref:helix-turn-helix domain-containing protein n=1 Tax=Streptococcus sp. 27098_8_66 TaxID=3003649 RepID=UPI00352F7082
MDRLSNNIKSLRKSMGESQEELAYSIDLNSKSAIANWESGINRPSPENLKKIAAHYRVTVDQLLGGDLGTDFSMVKMLNNLSKSDNYDYFHSFLCLFPIADFKKEEELYPKLVDAKNFHKECFECLKNQDENYHIYLTKAIEVYGELEKDECISAKANGLSLLILWLIMVKGCIDLDGIDECFVIKNEKKRRKEIKRFISENLLSGDTNSSDAFKQIVFEDFYKDIMEEIMALKRHKSLFQLGDYYHCILYLFDITDNDLGTAINQQIGSALLSDLSLMKNKHVSRIKYFSKKMAKVHDC